MQRLTDIAAQLCSPDKPLGAVMRQLNESLHPFVIVVDAARKPVGTVTDGDVRRAVLAGATLDTAITGVMNKKPMIARIDEPGIAHRMLERVTFVPIVDRDGALVELWRVTANKRGIETALVMAGGLGTRLGTRTEKEPKPLLPVGGKPILGHILDWLETSGIGKVYVSTHYLADQIKAFLQNRGGAMRPTVLYEDQLRGTAGALAQLQDPISGPVLIVNGDVLTRLDIDALAAFHHAHGYDGMVAVTPYKVSVPFGVIRKDESGEFEGIDEKPTYTHFVAAGIYLLSPQFCRLVPPDTRIDMPELLNLGRQAGLKIGLFPIHEYWIDVGRADDLDTANRDHASLDRPVR